MDIQAATEVAAADHLAAEAQVGATIQARLEAAEQLLQLQVLQLHMLAVDQVAVEPIQEHTTVAQ